jgi:hypothetical protein
MLTAVLIGIGLSLVAVVAAARAAGPALGTRPQSWAERRPPASRIPQSRTLYTRIGIST